MSLSFHTLFFVSIAAGFVGSMAGMGGGVVLTPALTWMGLPIKQAIALSIVSVIATSSGSAAAYVRDHLTNLKIGMFLEMFTIIGALVGAAITVHADPRWLYLTFGGVLLISWLLLFRRGNEEWHPVEKQDAFSRWLELEGSYPDSGTSVDYQATHAALGGGLMFGAGFIAGLLGIGAGVMGLPPKVSTTTSNLIIGVTALAGTSVYWASGLIEPGLAIPTILGILIGAFIGTRVLVRLRNQAVRHFFLIVLAVLGIEMVTRGLHGH
jgi:hypothetical protein